VSKSKKQKNSCTISVVAHTMGYGDSAACLEKNGIIYGPVEEERFTRNRYESGFPKNSIIHLLKISKTKPSDVKSIFFHLRPNDKLIKRLVSLGFNFVHSITDSAYPKAYLNLILMKRKFKSLGIKAPIKKFPHHKCHAAYSAFTSDFKNSLVITFDGAGDGLTGNVSILESNFLKELDSFSYPNSIGIFYSAISDYIGFPLPSGPGKVMGLSAYGDEEKYITLLNKLIKVEKGRPLIDKSFFEFHKNLVTPNSRTNKRWLSVKFDQLIGFKRRDKSQKLEQKHIDLAGALQKVTTKIGVDIVSYWLDKTGQKNLCLSGGVALNAVMNDAIFKKINGNFHVPPGCGDCGNTAGAIILDNMAKGGEALTFNSQQQYTGPSFKQEDVLKCLLDYKSVSYNIYDLNSPEERVKYIKLVAKEITNNKIIGWFHGKMEFGPRALGNRSILADPTNSNVKELINLKVKHREWFRPFAPSVLHSEFSKYFESDYHDPYMLTTPKVKVKFRDLLPAITHVDNTARVQSVKRVENPIYYDLISEIKINNGHGIVLNTSFNDNEPIVCNPIDAIECFLKTNIDLLAIEGVICRKS